MRYALRKKDKIASVYDWGIVDEKPKKRAVTAPMILPVNIPARERENDTDNQRDYLYKLNKE